MPSTSNYYAGVTAGITTLVENAQRTGKLAADVQASTLSKYLLATDELGLGTDFSGLTTSSGLAAMLKAVDSAELGAVAAKANAAPTLAKLAEFTKDIQTGPIAEAMRVLAEHQAIQDDLFTAAMSRRRRTNRPSPAPAATEAPTAPAPAPAAARVLPPPAAGPAPSIPLPSFATFAKAFTLGVGAPVSVFAFVHQCIQPYFADPTNALAAATAITIALALLVWAALFAAGKE